MALFVIYGVQNSGKTHTAWLVYNLLKTAGDELDFDPKSLTIKPTFSDVLQQIETSFVTGTPTLYSDFRALFEYNGKKIAIFSAGDFLEHPTWEVCSFKDNMKWADDNEADHVICCARYNKKNGGVRKYILDNYRMAVYRWYCKHWLGSAKEQKKEAQQIAIELFTDIKANC